MIKTKTPDPIILAMLRNQQFDELENYVSRGRQLGHTSVAGLKHRWATLMREWVKDFKGEIDNQERSDIQAELQLRGIELPIELIGNTFRSLQQLAQKAADEVEFDPDRKAAGEEWLRKELARLSIPNREKN